MKYILTKTRGIRAFTYDKAVRGVHRAPLIAEGIVVFAMQFKNLAPQPLMHYAEGPCTHVLNAATGRICERHITVQGETMYTPLPVLELEPRPGKQARFYHRFTIPCPRGYHDFRIRVDETKEDREIDPSTKRQRFN